MAERYPGGVVAANGFGRRRVRHEEVRMLFEAGYPVPPDCRIPGTWRLSQMGYAMPPLPTCEDRLAQIYALRKAMTRRTSSRTPRMSCGMPSPPSGGNGR